MLRIWLYADKGDEVIEWVSGRNDSAVYEDPVDLVRWLRFAAEAGELIQKDILFWRTTRNDPFSF